MAESTAPKAAGATVLDFSNVKDRGTYNTKHKPAGDYAAKVTAVLDTPAKDKSPMWTFVIQLEDDRGAVYPYRCKLVENQMWKIRNVLVAAGKQVPKKRVNVNPQTVVGKTIGVTLEDDEYEGKLRSQVQNVFPASDLPATEKAAAKSAEIEDEAVEDDDADATDDSGTVSEEEMTELDLDEV